MQIVLRYNGNISNHTKINTIEKESRNNYKNLRQGSIIYQLDSIDEGSNFLGVILMNCLVCRMCRRDHVAPAVEDHHRRGGVGGRGRRRGRKHALLMLQVIMD